MLSLGQVFLCTLRYLNIIPTSQAIFKAKQLKILNFKKLSPTSKIQLGPLLLFAKYLVYFYGNLFYKLKQNALSLFR